MNDIWAFVLMFYLNGEPQNREIVAVTSKVTCVVLRGLLVEELHKYEPHPELTIEISKCQLSTDFLGENL